jgi:hypothetical protein
MFESDLQNVTSENIFNAQHMINFQTPGGGTYIKTKYMISAFAYHIFPKLMENIGIPRTLRDLTRAVIKFLFVIPLEA